MELLKYFKLLPLLLVTLIQPVAASTGMIGSSAQAGGPLNLVLSLGIENIPGVTTQYALFIYRFFSFGIILLLAMCADRRTQDIFSILIVAFAAIFAWIGWWTVLLPNGNVNPAGPWSMVIFCAVIAGISYMTTQKRNNFGLNGAGDPVINLFMFFIIFNSCLGMLSSTQIFASVPGVPTAPPVCNSNNYVNCQVNGATQLQSIGTTTSVGGFWSTAADYVTLFTTGAYNAILLILSIALSLVFVAGTITITYPWILQSPPAMVLLGIFQVVIYVLYYLMIMRWTAKTMPGEGRV